MEEEDTFYLVTTKDGLIGPTWKCDDDAEALALAKEHGYEVLDLVESTDPLRVHLLVVAG